MSSEWRPLGIRDTPEVEKWDGPYDGVPSWLSQSLWDWVEPHFNYFNSRRGGNVISEDLLKTVERKLHLSIGFAGGPTNALNRLKSLVTDPLIFLRVVDFCVYIDSQIPSGTVEIERLDDILQESGSLWRVGAISGVGKGLERRVGDSAVLAAKAAAPAGSPPAIHLSRAWSALYGSSPNYAESYGQSIKAVEAAIIPIVIPNDPVPTLGKVIAALNDKPEKWQFPISSGAGVGGVRDVVGMMKLLWGSQPGRHGVPDVPPPVTSEEEADAALHLAVTLVHWCTAKTFKAAT